jgi:hypothetical protein
MCSAFLPIREMQIKITLRFYLAAVKMTVFKKTNNKRWQACRGKGTLINSLFDCKLR